MQFFTSEFGLYFSYFKTKETAMKTMDNISWTHMALKVRVIVCTLMSTQYSYYYLRMPRVLLASLRFINANERPLSLLWNSKDVLERPTRSIPRSILWLIVCSHVVQCGARKWEGEVWVSIPPDPSPRFLVIILRKRSVIRVPTSVILYL